MESTRWSAVQDLFHEALSHPEPERAAFLNSACGNDPTLIGEVVAMLAADSRGGSLLDRGLPDIAYRMIGSTTDAISSQEFGPYRLIRVLGEGGMGVVWLAERSDAGNQVAIKFLPHAGLTPARRDRFAREIRTLAKLNHPFIARLYDAGALSDGTPWFVMEYVEGVRLTEYCRAPGRTIEEQLRVFRSVCEAVLYAHGQAIIHRDLKPSNILVVQNGSPRLLDFGIARELHQMDDPGEQTRPGLRFLSPDYAAPEWAREGVVGLSTDVYSLGVILYEILTGRLPFAKRNSVSTAAGERPARSHAEKPSAAARRPIGDPPAGNPIPKLSKSEWSDLDVLCLKAMHEDTRERYPSVEALLRDIDHFLNNEPLDARPDSLLYRTGKFVRRNRTPVLATSITLILLAGTLGWFTVRLIESRAAALAAATRTQRIQRFMLNLFQGGDKDAGPAEDLRVVTLIDRGVDGAKELNREPETQADLYQTLGTMYQKLGRLDRADSLLQSSLHVRGTLPVLNSSAEADNLIVLGLLRSEQGNSKEAERLVRQALAEIQAHEPRDKVLLAEAESALGSVLVAAGQQATSVDVLNRAVSTLESIGSDPSPELAQTLGTLADAKLYLGRYDEADSLNRRALAIDRQVYGDLHPHIGDDLGNLAQTEEIRGRYADAEKLERQALAIMQGWYGKDHPETARKMTTLASTLNYEGNYAEAADLLRHALAIQERAYGPRHPRVAYVLNALGTVAIYQKSFSDAEEDYHRVIEIYRGAYGDSDYRVAVGMGNLASVYSAEKRYPECEHILFDVVGRFTRALGPANINTGIAQVRLGRTLLHENRYKDAEEHTRAGYESLKGQTSANTSYVQGARQDLAIEYAALDRPADADRFRNEAAGSAPQAPHLASGK